MMICTVIIKCLLLELKIYIHAQYQVIDKQKWTWNTQVVKKIKTYDLQNEREILFPVVAFILEDLFKNIGFDKSFHNDFMSTKMIAGVCILNSIYHFNQYCGCNFFHKGQSIYVIFPNMLYNHFVPRRR